MMRPVFLHNNGPLVRNAVVIYIENQAEIFFRIKETAEPRATNLVDLYRNS